MKFAMITVGAPGHILASLPMIRELVSRGNQVTYFAPNSFKDMIDNTGAEFYRVETVLTNDGKADKDIAVDMLAELPLRFLSEGEAAIKQILPVLEKDKPDAIITDALAIAGRLAASYLKLPTIMLFTSYASNNKFSVSRFWPVYPDDNPARAAAHKLADQFTDKYGVPHLDVYGIFEGKGDLNIVTQPKSFHPAGNTFADNFIFAGAQIAPRVDAGTWQAPAGDRPLLYTSLGTLFNVWPEFYKMLFEAVKDLPINVLSSIGTTLTKEDLGEIPANVTTASFLPQLDVLQKTSYFITHAGTGSVMEAIYYGVPMLAIPQMDEQVLTAGRMEELGLGLLIMKEQLTVELLRTSIRELIENSKYKNNVLAMQKEMRENGGAEYAADAIMDFMSKLNS